MVRRQSSRKTNSRLLRDNTRVTPATLSEVVDSLVSPIQRRLTVETIDRKFKILAVNPCNGKHYTDKNALLLCAHDKAVPAALRAYRDECIRLGCEEEHFHSIELLIERVEEYQKDVESRIPDTNLDCEIRRCIGGEGLED